MLLPWTCAYATTAVDVGGGERTRERMLTPARKEEVTGSTCLETITRRISSGVFGPHHAWLTEVSFAGKVAGSSTGMTNCLADARRSGSGATSQATAEEGCPLHMHLTMLTI